MIENNNAPLEFGWMSYAFVIFVSCWGGLVNYLHKIQSDKTGSFSITALISDLSISGFSGIIVFWLCMWKEVDMLLTSVAVGIAGHLGSRTIFLIEKVLENKYGKYFKQESDAKEIIEDIEDALEELRGSEASADDVDKVLERVKDKYKNL